jgi:biotin carboxyl carrier protein
MHLEVIQLAALLVAGVAVVLAAFLAPKGIAFEERQITRMVAAAKAYRERTEAELAAESGAAAVVAPMPGAAVHLVSDHNPAA